MIYLTVGESIRQGVSLYSEVHENKPPMLYILAAIAGNLFWFKVMLAFWHLATVIIFYYLTKRLFSKQRSQKVATFIFAMVTTLPLLEGNIVNSELFMVGLSTLSILILIGEKLNYKKVIFAGFIFGIATLFKVPAIFDIPVIIVYWLITDLKNLKQIFIRSLLLGLGFAVPVGISFVWFFLQGSLPEYVVAAFLQNVGYLSSFRPDDVKEPFFVKNLPLLIRAGVVGLGTLILFLLRSKLSKKFILATVWILFALFAAALSERPYPHYLVQALPPLSILIAMFFVVKTMEQVYVVLPLTLALIVPVYYKFWVYPTAGYYLKFIDFVRTGDKEVYFSKFSSGTNRNYKISEFLITSSTKEDKVFMWDPDSSTVYALARRLPPIKYVADYHVNDFSSKSIVAKELEEESPKFIILTSNHPFPEIFPLLKSKYLLINQIENADIYSRIKSQNL